MKSSQSLKQFKAELEKATKFQHEIPIKFTPASVSASLTLVGFILVGSIAVAGLALAVQSISQVNHQDSSIAKLEQMIAILQTSINNSKSGSTMRQVSMNDSTSRLEQRVLNLQNTVNDHSEFQTNISSEIDTISTYLTSEIERVSRSLSSEIDRVSRSSSSELDRFSRSLSPKIDNIVTSLSGQYPNLPSPSCSNISLSNSFSPSGHYWIRSSNGSAVRVYCDFNRQCGCDGPSAWTRVAFLNMSDPSHVCPSNWLTISNPVRVCGKGASTTGCGSVYFSTFGMTYYRVCGRITAYQYGAPDALNHDVTQSRDIDAAHLDGVSLTHGRESRQHIWSFICAAGEGNTFRPFTVCACSNTGRGWPYSTSYLGNDYFCDSGNHGPISSSSTFYSDDPLWDGQGCGPLSTCCQFNNPPWFCKTLPQSTTDDLEVRICKNSINEDTPVQLVELYIQ